MGCAANWRLVFPDPPAGFQLIVTDLRGHGPIFGPWTAPFLDRAHAFLGGPA
jgi:hypothetical protein